MSLTLSCKTATSKAKDAGPPGDAALASGDRSVAIQLKQAINTWQGWGASLSWWASTVGGSSFAPTYADLFYTTNTVSLLGKQVPGLGLNVVRYNIGSSGQEGDNFGEIVSPQMPAFRKIAGYWPTTPPTAAAVDQWQWQRDANQRNMLQLAVARGADQVEFFANAPMWWMMDSKSADGGTLLPAHFNDYIAYLTGVVDHAAKAWNIPVTSLAPFNEPSALWWAYPKNQEGSSFPPPLQPQVLAALRQRLDQMGYQKVGLAGADENSVQDAVSTLLRYQNQPSPPLTNVEALLAKINIHGYFNGTNPQRDNGARSLMRSAAGKEPVWISEYTDGDPTGQTLATTIMEDLSFLQPTAWVYWQPVEPGNQWSFVYGDYGGTIGQPLDINTKYYVMATFSRFLRPGQQIFASGDPSTVVSYDATQRRLTIVALVSGSPQRVSYDLSQLTTVPKSATLTLTSFDGASLLASRTVAIPGNNLSLDVGATGIYALVLDGVTP